MPVRPWGSAYCRFLLRQRVFVSVLAVAVTLVGVFWALRVPLSARISDYYPHSHAYIRLYQEFPEMLKMTNTVVVTLTVKDGTVYSSETLGKIHRITVGLIETKGVNPFEVMSLTHSRLKDIKIRDGAISILPVVDRPGEVQDPTMLTRVKNAVYTNLGIRGVYVSPDNKTALIRAGFWDGEAEPRAVFRRLQDLTEPERDANTDITFAGNLVLAGWLIGAAPRFLMLLFVSLGMLFLLAGLGQGFLNGGVSTLFVTLLGIVGGFGLVGSLGLTLAPLALLVLFPLSARGIMLVSSWQAQLAREHQNLTPFAERAGQEQALEHTAVALWRPLTGALCADGGAMLVLALISDVPAFQSLGYLSLGWIGGLLFGLWIVLPVWSSLLRPHREPKWRGRRGWGGQVIDRVVRGLQGLSPRSLGTRIGVGVVSVLGLLAALQLEAGRMMLGTTLFYPAHPYNRAFALLNEKFIGANQLIVIAQTNEGAGFRDLHALQTLEAFQYHMAEDPQFGGSLTVTGLIKSITRMFHEDIPKWEMLPDDIHSTGQIIFRIVAAAATPSEVERFLSTDFRTTALTLFYRDYSPEIITHALVHARAFAAAQDGSDVTIRLGGGILGVLAAINAAVESSYWTVLGGVVLFTALGALLVLGSVRAGLVMIATLVLSQAVVLIVLWLGNIDLNMYTLPVIVVSIGMILIPAFLRWVQDGESLFQAQALVASTLTVAAAAAVWLFSPMRLQAEMGLLLIVLALANIVILLRMQNVLGDESGVRGSGA